MNFVIPPKSQVGSLDPEIANEGLKVAILSDGEAEQWTPPDIKSAFPDWSQVPKLKKYFGRKGGPVYPAWLFHPTEADRLVHNAEEAGNLGVVYRKATDDERFQFGHQSVWDWKRGDEDQKWRPFPQQRRKFDPHHMETGKVYQKSETSSQPDIGSLVAAVTASVLAAMKAPGSAPTAPAHVNSREWEEFLAFQAFKKTTETVNALAAETEEADDRALWIAEADRLGMKIDKRWSDERLKSEVLAKKAA
jgi:hypothetical protein